MEKLWQSKKELLIQNLPPILKTLNYFCLTKDKKPYDIWGNLIKPNNKNDFTSFQNCLLHLNNGFDTLGIGLFDNLCGIDIDHCVDDEGRLNNTAREVLNLYPDMYAEYSPSKNGIHLIGYSNYHIDKNKYYFKHNSLEVYSGLDTVRYLNALKIDGIKIHMLNIIKDTPLAKMYEKEKFHLLTKEEYIDIVIKQLELLDPKIVIHRITSDPDPRELIEPKWLVKKFCLLNDIDKEMKKRETYQGKLLSPLIQRKP